MEVRYDSYHILEKQADIKRQILSTVAQKKQQRIS